MTRSFRMWTSAALPVLTVMALALAGCSSSSSSGPGSSTASNSPQSTPIAIGAIGAFSGVASASTADAKVVFQDWVSMTNASGGINGHPVQAFIQDDQNSPSVALSSAKQLVEQDHVKVIVDLSDNAESAWAKVADTAQVPVLGQSESPLFGTDPNFFPTGTTAVSLIYGELKAASLAKVSKLGAFYCAEIANCSAQVPLTTAMGKLVGVQLAYSAKISSTASSYTAECLGAKNAGAQGITVTAASDTALRAAESCATQGYKPTWVTTAGEATASWLAQPAVNGSIGNVQDVPWFDNSIPATKTMQAAIAKYSPGVTSSSSFGAIAVIGWAAGTVFASVAKTAGLGPDSSSAAIIAALDTVKNDTFGGITPPLTYTAGKPTSVPCSYIIGIKNGNWTEPIGLQTVCQPTP